MLRRIRLAELIKEELSNIISFDIKDDRINKLSKFISVMRVELSSDLRYATVYISIFNKETSTKNDLKVLEIINHAKSFIRQLLKKRIRAKIIPQLNFKLDYSIQTSMRLEELLKQQDLNQLDQSCMKKNI